MKPGPETEMTPEGEQIVMPGVKSLALPDRLAALAAMPIAPERNPDTPQEPRDLGLFDEAAHNQFEILNFLRAAGGGASPPPPKPTE